MPSTFSNSRAMIGVGAVFLLLGVIPLISPTPHTSRGDGAAIVLFGLVATIVGVGRRRTERGGGRPRLTTVNSRPAVVIRAPRLTRAANLAGTLLFGLLSLALAVGASPIVWRVIGAAGALLFATASVALLRRARHPYGLTVTPEELHWSAGSAPGHLRWDEVANVSLLKLPAGDSGDDGRFLCFDARRGVDSTPVARSMLDRVNREISSHDVSIALDLLPVDPKRLRRAVADYAAHPELRPEIGTPRSLERIIGKA